MPTNLFDLLDGLFRGTIYFFYNFLETAYRVVRQPTSGPLLLFRRHRNPAQRQMGGLTFLFLSFFVLFSLWPLALGGSDARGLGKLSQTISGLPNLEMKSLWPTVAGALLGTVVIDAPIRLFLWWKLSRERLRREIILGGIHYAIFIPVLVGLGGVIAAIRLVLIEGFVRVDLIVPGWMSALAGVALLTGWLTRPAATLLARVSLRGKSVRDQRRYRRICIVALTMLVGAAIYAGAVAALGIGSESQDQADARRHLRVVAIRCEIENRILSVSAVLWNPSQEPKVLDLGEDITTAIGSFRRKAGLDTLAGAAIYQMKWLEPKDNFQIVEPGQTLRLRGTSPVNLQVKREDRCGLSEDGNLRESIMGATWPVGDPPIGFREKNQPATFFE